MSRNRDARRLVVATCEFGYEYNHPVPNADRRRSATSLPIRWVITGTDTGAIIGTADMVPDSAVAAINHDDYTDGHPISPLLPSRLVTEPRMLEIAAIGRGWTEVRNTDVNRSERSLIEQLLDHWEWT